MQRSETTRARRARLPWPLAPGTCRQGRWQLAEWIGFGIGIVVVLGTGSSILHTLLLPRGESSLLSRLLARLSYRLFAACSRPIRSYGGTDRLLALQGPVFLLAELVSWLTLLGFGFALILLPYLDGHVGNAIRESGSSLLTLGFQATDSAAPTAVDLAAGVAGFGVITLLIAYLPTIYGAFNRREEAVTLLESRAGDPPWGPELLARQQLVFVVDQLAALYAIWEQWAADVAETHTSYPVLVMFRSPHPLRSWIVAHLAVLDAAAIHLAVSPESAPHEARLCLRMGFTTLRGVAETLALEVNENPRPDDPIELTYDEFAQAVEDLRDYGFPMERSAEEAWPHFKGWRVNYERAAYGIADLVAAPPAPWSGPRHHFDAAPLYPRRPPHREPTRSES